ncbi:MAG: hypothetical protein CL902_03010 [Dehalococcoidia bacterium]|nr:hypothetical protein [Dehalococcoidia bacterium]
MMARNANNLARIIGLPEDDIVKTVEKWFGTFSAEEAGVAFTNIINAGNLMMRWQMEDIAKLAAAARQSGSVTDLALLQRAYINAEVWMRHVDAVATDWGRAGEALQGRFFPKASALPSRKTLMDPKRAAAFLKGSGLDVAANGEELIALVEEAVKAHGGTRGRRVVNDVLPRVIRESNRTIGSRATSMFMETYINALLSSPATSGFTGITTVSPALVTIIEGAQHFAGGLLPQALGGPQGYGQSIEAVYNFFRWFRNAGHGLRQMLRTYMNEGSIFLPNHEVIDAPRAQGKAISYGQGRAPSFERRVPILQPGRSRETGGNWLGQQGFMVPDTAAGDSRVLWYLVNSSGRGVRLPGNLISTADELYRVANGRTALEADLYAKEMHQALTNEGLADANWLKKSAAVVRLHKDVAQRAKAGVERHISNGRLRTRTVLLEEAQQLPEVIKLRESGLSADQLKAMKIVKEYMTKNWKGYTDEATGTFVPGLESGVDVATAGATTATFTGPVTSGLGKWFQTGLNRFPVLRILVPFYRTPAKLFERFGGYLPSSMAIEGVNRSWGAARGHGWTIQPDSAIAQIHRVNMARLASGDARQIAIVRGQQAMGIAMFATGYDLAASGTITGGGPANRDTRELWRQTGWRPYSVRIGDTYYSYKKGDPWAIALGTMADTYEYISAGEGGSELEEERMGMVTAVMYAIVGNMQDKNMMQGLDNLLQLSRARVETGGSLDSVLISMFTPTTPIANIDITLARQTLRASHPALYEARTMLDSLRTQTWIGMVTGPGEAPIMRNILGEPLTLESMGEVDGTSWLNMFLPGAISERTGDLVMEGLVDIDYPGDHPSMVKENVRMLQYIGAGESATPVESEWTGLPTILSAPDPDWVDDEGLQPYDYWKREIGRVKLEGVSGRKVTLRESLLELFGGESGGAKDYAALNEDTPGNRKVKREVVSEIINAYRAVAYINTKNNMNDDGSLAYAAWLVQIDAAREMMTPTVDRSAAGSGELAEQRRRDARDPRHTTQGVGTRDRNDIEDVVEQAGERP